MQLSHEILTSPHNPAQKHRTRKLNPNLHTGLLSILLTGQNVRTKSQLKAEKRVQKCRSDRFLTVVETPASQKVFSVKGEKLSKM